MHVHLPTCCPSRGRTVSAEEKHIVIGKRQVFDLPEPKLEVIEHRLGQIECCGQAQIGKYPAYVRASVQYGPGVRGLVTKYSVDHKMPLEQICGLFSDLYGYDLNSETVESTLEQGYCLTTPQEADVIEALKRAAAVNFDETGLRVAGKLHWLLQPGMNIILICLFMPSAARKPCRAINPC